MGNRHSCLLEEEAAAAAGLFLHLTLGYPTLIAFLILEYPIYSMFTERKP